MKLIKLNAISSTNDYLKTLVAETTVEDETIVWADEQTNGRGMFGTHWFSKAQQSLTFSIFKQYSSLSPDDQVYINFAVAIGVINTFRNLKIPSLSVKWANDIMSENKKICGILIENQTGTSKVRSSVVGIGVNVNNENFEGLPQAGSMLTTGGVKFDLEEVLNILSEEVLRQLRRLDKQGFESLKPEFEELLFRKDEVTVFEDNSGTRFNGIIQGVSKTGELVLLLEDDKLSEFGLKQLKMLY